jgi:3-deoxy-D-manno-octulosonic-acid transferase
MPQISNSQLLASLRPYMKRERIATLVFEPFHLLRMGPGRRDRLAGLVGYHPGRSFHRSVWIHAINIGEMKTAITLVDALHSGVPLVVTTYDPTSLRLAREHLKDRAVVTHFPALFPGPMCRFLRRFAPEKLILIEGGDLHPQLLLAAVGRTLPAVVVDGWFNEIQLRRLRDFVSALGSVQMFCVRHAEDRNKLVELGIPEERIEVTGDLKFETAIHPAPNLEAQIRELAGERPILIAGSTNPKEEPAVLDAFERMGGGQRALLILATRHPRDFAAAEALLRHRGLDYRKRSRFPASGRPAVVLLDRVGELASLYPLAAAVFVGGSLVTNGGGQNPIEAARAGVPIAVGPFMRNFQSVAELFDAAGAWQRVSNPEELTRAWRSWLDDPELARTSRERAAQLVAGQRGALGRTLTLLASFLDGSAAGLDN